MPKFSTPMVMCSTWIEDFIEMAWMCLTPFRLLRQDVRLAGLKERYGSRLVFCGAVDTSIFS
jgi:hypothetical protein